MIRHEKFSWLWRLTDQPVQGHERFVNRLFK
jgi:hypothetical protein